MKITKTLLAFAVTTAGFVASANAQSVATATAAATLITPISITVASDLNFGTVASSGSAGTVTMSEAGVAAANGGASLPAGGAARTTASFTVTGEGTSTFSVSSMPASIELMSGVAGPTLTIDGISTSTGVAGTLVAGSATINVAATLQVPAGAVAGDYTSATGLPVTVNYN
jgi:hypothetical protein